MSGPAGRRDGIAVIDKPPGCTSHDVVAQARRLLGTRKVGHSGTLDPDATGVLILGVGRATRLLRYLTALGKTYEATVTFGVATDTCDAAGDAVGAWDMSDLTEDRARAAATAFVGDIQQIPPMVSAVKVGGRRLHELAREGRTVPREPRTVSVGRFEMTGFGAGDRPWATVTVACSAGTYVRTLAADWGAALGGGAHLAALRRTAVGSFTVAEARPLERLELLAPSVGVRDYASLTVPESGARAVACGQRLPATGLAGPGPWAVLDESGSLLAMCERRGDCLQPTVVLATTSGASGAPGGGEGPADR
ncbi:MAG: tRNA pseudouridine(55) synthase TruB [bacterium]|nr:tRNA pseudouridine(55) synthase TruB [bacterium]MDE0669250.1 tRNA pseudouridine(55) synthase TruB [bacterium]MYB24704.1 tRNA pseudouridine(55) synthase TruB [Acidimicrobiia bacterium]